MSRSGNVDLIQDGRAEEVPQKAHRNSGDDEGNGLVPRVRAKRAEVEQYLRLIGVRRRRLVTVTIFAAAISTLLTALAALWGQQLTRWFTDTFGTATDGWRMLCTLAAACSLTAGVAAQLQTSKNYEERLAQAQEIMASLEALEVAITLGHLNQNEATGQYLKIIEGTSFMHQAG
jgi:AcrR family transcriptional regulator